MSKILIFNEKSPSEFRQYDFTFGFWLKIAILDKNSILATFSNLAFLRLNCIYCGLKRRPRMATPVWRYYKLLDKVLGKGSFGTVIEAVNVTDENDRVAVKKVDKAKVKHLC